MDTQVSVKLASHLICLYFWDQGVARMWNFILNVHVALTSVLKYVSAHDSDMNHNGIFIVFVVLERLKKVNYIYILVWKATNIVSGHRQVEKTGRRKKREGKEKGGREKQGNMIEGNYLYIIL